MTRTVERQMVNVNGICMDMALAEALLGKAKVLEYFDRQRTELVDQIEDLETRKMDALKRFEDHTRSAVSSRKSRLHSARQGVSLFSGVDASR